MLCRFLQSIQKEKKKTTTTFNYSLCCWNSVSSTGAKQKHRNRVLGEVAKSRLIALPGKGGHSGPVTSRLCAMLERAVRGHTSSAWSACGRSVGGEVIGSQHHQTGSKWSGFSVLVGSMQLISSTWWGFSICKTAQRTWLRILLTVLKKELKVLEFNG